MSRKTAVGFVAGAVFKLEKQAKGFWIRCAWQKAIKKTNDLKS